MLHVTKYIEFTKEVEISITAEDISQCLVTSPLADRLEAAREMIANCTKVLSGIPDTVIAELHPEFCKTVTHAFAEATRRFSARGTVLILTEKCNNDPAAVEKSKSNCLDDSCTGGKACNVCINRNIVAKRGFELIQIIEKVPASVQQTCAVAAAEAFIHLAEEIYLSQGE